MKQNITFETMYNNHSINTNKEKQLGCYTKALEKIERSLDRMLEKHSKIMLVRFDVRYPDDENIMYKSNQPSDFAYNLKRSLNREKTIGGHKVDAKVIHVQEQDSSKKPHFHFAVVVNANAKNRAFPILQKADALWKTMMKTEQGGLVDFCNSKRNGIVIDKHKEDFQEHYDEVFHQASYLAKTRGKEKRDKGSWLIKTSR